jgi:hypothetical protein
LLTFDADRAEFLDLFRAILGVGVELKAAEPLELPRPGASIEGSNALFRIPYLRLCVFPQMSSL